MSCVIPHFFFSLQTHQQQKQHFATAKKVIGGMKQEPQEPLMRKSHALVLTIVAFLNLGSKLHLFLCVDIQ
jgi:hypothetical protein